MASSIDIRLSPRIHLPNIDRCLRRLNSNPIISSQGFNFSRLGRSEPVFLRRSTAVACLPKPAGGNEAEDFVARVLKENPSQVEPRYLVGDKLFTLKEKESLGKSFKNGVLGFVSKMLSLGLKSNGVANEIRAKDDVVLKDLLREYKGKLYVPEQVFGKALSEEEEFAKSFELLPKMSLEDFEKALKSDKVKMLTWNEPGLFFRDFIVELKEIPGDKSLQRRKWAIRLEETKAEKVMEEYKGLCSHVEKPSSSWVGKLQEYPHPVASTLSSRIMVEFGMLTAVIAAAGAVVGGYLASAVLAATSFVYVTALYVLWPLVRPFAKFLYSVIYGVCESIWDEVLYILKDGNIISKLSDMWTVSGVWASITLSIPIFVIVMSMVLVLRFTLSRRPKNFKQWDIWMGIEFSRSKAEARVDGSTGVKFSDVAGIDEAVEELQELVRYLKNPELFDKIGIKPPHGVLLEGPPGCGKTLVAKAIAGEAGVPFYQMAGSEFVEVLVGVGSARIRDLFKRAKVNKPSVIFIDEIDALATRREGIYKETTNQLYNAATQERETTLNQLLIELDGFDTGKGVIFLAATNRRDLLDPALLRPGRFDRKIKILPPAAKGRLDILKIYAKKVKMSESVDLSGYAKNLPGWSGAQLAQLIQEAALVAVRNGHKSILSSDMDEAVDRLTVGPKRAGIELGHQGQCRRATTEAGVALTSHLLRRYEDAKVEFCDRISIVPRGQTLSQLIFRRLDDELYIFERRPQLLHRLQVLLGGRAAEEVIYGHDTSMASISYLADASYLARKILTIWNLENPMTIHGEPSPWRKKPKFIGPRLDFEGSLYDDYGLIEPPVNFNLDDDIAVRTEELLRDTYQRTLSLLQRHHAALLKTVKVLLNQKEIIGEEIDFILDKYPPQTPINLLLEEENPGVLNFVRKDENREIEYALVTQSSHETV